MNIRAEVYSPLQNTAVWLGAWLYGAEPTDALIDALGELGSSGLVDKLGMIRSISAAARERAQEAPVRLVLSGAGEAPALPANSAAAAALAEQSPHRSGALVFPGAHPAQHHILLPDASGHWQSFEENGPFPSPSWLSPGEADHLLSEATSEAVRLIDAAGFSPLSLPNPRLSVGTLSDFYDTPGLPKHTAARAAKLFARADTIAAIIETVTERLGEHQLDPQLFALWRHIRTARMVGVEYAVREFARA